VLVLFLILGLWYEVYLVQRYGGTPGKLLLGIVIQQIDGRPVDYRAAFLRQSVNFVLQLIGVAGSAIAAMKLGSQSIYR